MLLGGLEASSGIPVPTRQSGYCFLLLDALYLGFTLLHLALVSFTLLHVDFRHFYIAF